MKEDFAISVLNVNKTYLSKRGSKVALQDFSLNIPRGKFFALLGPNGAGKSTIINIIASLVTKDSGTVKICGYDIDTDMKNARRHIGVVPQEINFDPFFSPIEALELQAGLYGIKITRNEAMEILDSLGLADKANAYVRSLSGGMQRRLLIAKALVHRPPVLILDEPTAGVDIELRHGLWKFIKKLHAQGQTVILTTHYLEEAEELCDDIAIINHGKLITAEEKHSFIGRVGFTHFIVEASESINPNLKIPHNMTVDFDNPKKIIFKYKNSDFKAKDVLQIIHNEGIIVEDIQIRPARLEDVFLSLTRK